MKYEIYSGAGNGFVMINNWDNKIPFEQQESFTIKICGEKFKDIDGVIFVDKPKKENSSVRMNYFNRDGSFGAMCGNGARCIAMFSYKNDIVKADKFILEAVEDLYSAEVCDDFNVKISFPEPKEIRTSVNIEADFGSGLKLMNVSYVNVGSDHIVVFMDNEQNKQALDNQSLNELDVNFYGKVLRFHNEFHPHGGNVNFVLPVGENELRLRTYERGVERETLACGTGIVSTGIISVLSGYCSAPVSIQVQSGEWLTVDLNYENSRIADLFLTGSARKTGEGEI